MTETHPTRRVLFNQLLIVPHQNYTPLVGALSSALESDPDFISRSCVFIARTSEIRDQVDSAIITLLQSPHHYGYRESGRCLLLGDDVYEIEPSCPGLPFFRILRVPRYIAGSNRKVPRLMKSIAGDYAAMLEFNPRRFDGVVLRSRKPLKWLYTHYHLQPGPRAQAILFDDAPPPDSKLAILKQIANTTDIHKQARLVVQHKIPYVVATSVLPKMSPVVAVALIDVMSPQEALNSRAWVEDSGILNIPEVKDVFVAKVSQATRSAATVDHRRSAKGKDADVEAAVQIAKERSVAKQKKIEEPILLLIDISSSMERYFPFVCQLGARIAPLCEAGLMVVLFNDFARELKVGDTTLSAWQNGLRGVRASGWTSPLAGLSLALRGGYTPGKTVVLTDGGENRPHNRVGAFANGLSKLEEEMPSVVVIGVPDTSGMYHRNFAQSIRNVGAHVDEFVTDGQDYYVLDQVASVLGGPPAVSIVQRIMEVEMPRRVS